jgi:hypothetical protein
MYCADSLGGPSDYTYAPSEFNRPVVELPLTWSECK